MNIFVPLPILLEGAVFSIILSGVEAKEAIVPKDVNVNPSLVNTSWSSWNLAVEATGIDSAVLEPLVVPPMTCVCLLFASNPSSVSEV